MITQTEYTRGEIAWKEYRGTDENGDFNLYHREVLPNEDELYRQHEPADMHIRWFQGKLQAIVTQWQEVWITKTGKHSGIPAVMLDMTSSPYDTRFFLLGLGEPIAKSMSNGKIRAIDGYDSQPLWNSTTMQRIPDSEYDTQAAPTHTYHLPRNPDGTIIYPVTDEDETI